MTRAINGLIVLKLIAVLAVSSVLAGCAGGNAGAGGLPSGESCSSIKAKLSRLDAKGVQGSVEAQSRGQKLSGQQKADADAYNSLLNQYLGGSLPRGTPLAGSPDQINSMRRGNLPQTRPDPAGVWTENCSMHDRHFAIDQPKEQP